ncbi:MULTISPECIES: NAD-dependent epimerase/dehydratase family protein [unclassified Bifidobacterium]|uniref:NAD-dependent epimerase/dehydratase family protein n=1 Tax=unclassified Bifidobacterium TaxID=2608897 RepID=UPI00112AAF4E|nr:MULTISPECIES: NAD-dependent epimerase/dehydratase family protein [unclassified Bifidobacterium]TPF78525.1 hypothetical protein BW09_03375 [Bifidobacterium sp. UTCIF-1]TPF80805.1 hypothetical protein BW08_02330 [Bifidobacterium sp. UTCIF-24]TPF82755.1 hypothetical protein BW12_03290 [Bifidobacterium sp. UTCIF-3]TPF84472.1 hypothetical protein BW07_04265 [Bifidobacterium sp. UTCIF-36]TPF90968.1 hypothetical protein BW10_01765 [Bifidobacterium sp. UTBIF-56]
MDHNILITGGAGFIGSAIVNRLHSKGDWDVTVLDSLSEQIHGREPESSYLYRSIQGKCRFIRGDVRDLNAMLDAIDGVEYVIHLAAETGTGQSMYEINRYNEVNIMGTSNLLQAISTKGKASTVSKIVLSSSRSVYGEGKYSCPNCGFVNPSSRTGERMLAGDFNLYCDSCGAKLTLVATTEDTPAKPRSLYAFTKLAQEQMLATMCPALGIDYTVFRFQNVYGVGQSLDNPYTGILSVFSTRMLRNQPINIFEDGLESRDFVNVKDVAAGVAASLTHPESNGETINLGSGVNTSVIDIANILKDAYASSSEINITGDFRIGDIAHNKADITKARTLLGFEPSISLHDGLNAFCKWVGTETVGDNGYEHSLEEMEHAGMFVRKQH